MEDMKGCFLFILLVALVYGFVVFAWMIGWDYISPLFHGPNLDYPHAAMMILLLGLSGWAVSQGRTGTWTGRDKR